MRETKPYWKTSHKCWYVNLHGKPVRLDPDREAAWKKWHEVKITVVEPVADPPVIELIIRFLDWSEKHHRPSTYEWYRDRLECFYKSIGKLKLSKLKPLHVTRWLGKRYKKKPANDTAHGAIRAIQRMLNWNKKEGWIKDSPLAGIVKPQTRSRDAYLMPTQYLKLLGCIKDQAFLDFVEILRHTGCRPIEARTVTAQHFDGTCWVFPADEAKGQREPRVVLLNTRALAITRRLAKERPIGPLFLNTHRIPWNKDSLNCRCRVLAEKLEIPLCCYGIRHTFATEAIIRGVDLISIAELMGHKDLRMLTRIYQHIKKRGDHLKAALKKATG